MSDLLSVGWLDVSSVEILFIGHFVYQTHFLSNILLILELGFTRCIHAVDILEKFIPVELQIKAEFKNGKVDQIERVDRIDIGMTYTKVSFIAPVVFS